MTTPAPPSAPAPAPGVSPALSTSVPPSLGAAPTPLASALHTCVETALALLTGFAVAVVALRSDFRQGYDDLITGSMGWGGGLKMTDYAAIGGALGTAVLSLGLIRLAWRRTDPVRAEAVRSAMVGQMLWALVPLAVFAATVFGGRSGSEAYSVALAIGWFAVIGAAFVDKRTSADDAPRAAGLLVATLLLAASGAIAVVSLMHRVQAPGVSAARDFSTDDLAAVAGYAVGGAVLVGALWSILGKVSSVRALRGVLVPVQAAAALGVFAIVPPPMVFGGGEPERMFGGTPGLWIAAGVLYAVALADLIVRTARVARGTTDRAVSPFCLVGPLVLLVVGGIVPSISADDYHSGETYLSASLLLEHGTLPFVGYDPARGIVMYIPGLVAELCMDGTAASYPGAFTIANALLAAGILLVVRPFVGAPAAFVGAMVSMYPAREPAPIAAAAIVVLVGLAVRRRPSTWLALWPVIGTVAVLLAPASGAAAVLATVPLACVLLVRALRDEPKRAVPLGIATVALAGIVVLLTPLGDVILGMIAYIRSHAGVNSAAHAVGMHHTRGKQLGIPYPIYEMFRFSWLALIPAGLAMLWHAKRSGGWGALARAALWCVPIMLFCLLVIPRAAGRVPAGTFGRTGMFSVASFALLLPAMIVAMGPTDRRRWLAVVPLALAAFAAPIGGNATHWASPGGVLKRALLIGYVADPIDGAEIGVPRLGKGSGIREHTDATAKLARVVDAALLEGETFFDLSNRNGLAYYFDRPPPARVAAPYNLPTSEQQIEASEAIESAGVELVLADRPIAWDKFPMSSRANLIWRYIVARFTPVVVDDVLVFARGGALERLLATGRALRLPDESVRQRILRLETRTIGRQGAAWAYTIDRIREHALDAVSTPALAFTKAHDAVALSAAEAEGEPGWFRVTGKDPHLVLTFAEPLDPRSAGVLVLDAAYKGNWNDPIVLVRWATTEDPGFDGRRTIRGSVMFEAKQGDGGGRLVFPLDAHSGWLAAPDVTRLRLDIEPPPAGGRFRIEVEGFYQRRGAAFVDRIGAVPPGSLGGESNHQ